MLNHSDEHIYDENMLHSFKNIQTSADLCGSSAIVAIKITAFVAPKILEKLNRVIEEQDESSCKFSVLECASNTLKVHTIYIFFLCFQ